MVNDKGGFKYDTDGLSPVERRLLSALAQMHMKFGVQLQSAQLRIDRLQAGQPIGSGEVEDLAFDTVQEAARETVEFLNEKFPDINAKVVRG